MFLRNATIRTRLAAMAVVPFALIAVLAVASYMVVQNLSVNGPAYNRIAQSKDFVAETNTSSLYILNASVISHQAVINRAVGQRAGILGSMDVYRRTYEASYEEWLPKVADPRARANLLDSHAAAEEYFRLFDTRFRPDVLAGDYPSAIAVLNNEMDTAFIQHESAIKLVVVNSAAAQRNEEMAAEAQKRRDSRILGILMAILALMTAALGFSTLRSITRRLDRLRDVATKELPRTIETVKTATLAGEELPPFEPVQVGGRDELTETAAAFNSVVGTAVDLAADQARTRRATAEMFVNLGRRNHKLLSRTLTYISQLERDERDPSTLQNLFKLDHLTTRMRRHAESLLVLAGSAPLRTWSRPVPVSDVLRSALSEIESYDRVDVTSMDEVYVKGAVVSDVAHLLAELLENATTFSPPHTRVRVVGRGNSKRYNVIIVDEGIGMTPDDLVAANEMLTRGHEQGVDALGSSRMLGLGVVARLAARHGMDVALDDSPVGGVVAKITLPPVVLADAGDVGEPASPERHGSAPGQHVAAPFVTGAPAAPSAASSLFSGEIRPVPAAAHGTPTAGPQTPAATGPITTALPRRNLSGAAGTEPVAPSRPDPHVIDLREDAGVKDNGRNGTALTQDARPATDGLPPLRRRVRGAQLPETGPLPAAPTPTDEVVRDARTVRDALSSFTQGRRGGQAATNHHGSDGHGVTGETTSGNGVGVNGASAVGTVVSGVAVGGVTADGVVANGVGHLPVRSPGATRAGEAPAAPAFRFEAAQAPLRRRVRGAQLPDMSAPVAPPPPTDRTADSVRSALAGFVAGQRNAREVEHT